MSAITASASLGNLDPDVPLVQMGVARYLDDLSPAQRDAFRASFGEITDLKGIFNIIQREVSKKNAQKRTSFIHKIEKISKPLQQFSAAIDVIAQTQAVFSWIWGPLKAVILVVKTYVDALEMIARVFEQITLALTRFSDYEDLFPTSPTIRLVLLDYYAYLIRFLVRTFKIYTRKRGVFLMSMVQPLKAETETAVKAILERSQEVDVQALVANMKQSKNERALQARAIADLSIQLQSRGDKDLRLWLSPADCGSEHRRRLSLRLPGTCQWFLDTPQFNNTISASNPDALHLFWLSGKPGCGKSILASAVISHVSQSSPIPLLFYFFNAVREDQSSFTSLLRSLLFQLLDLDPSISSLLMPLYKSSGEDHPTSPDLLWIALLRALDLKPSLVIILDALDECEDKEILLPRLLELIHIFPAIRMILISRPLFDISSALLGNSCHHQIEATDVRVDIEAYISSCVEASVKLQKTNMKKEIVTSLAKGSDGMFLWARLLLDDLTTLPTVKEIKKRLSALPSGLYAIYRQILSGLKTSLKPHQVELCKRVLTWVTSSQRPLKVSELDVALAVNPGDSSLDMECRMLMPETDILQACGPLVEIIGGSVLQVVHLSVKEFLTRPKTSWSQEDEAIKELLIDPPAANTEVAEKCISYLSFDNFRPPFKQSRPGDELLTYATMFWIQHFSQSGSKLCGYVEQFTMSDHAIFWIESWMHEYHKSRGTGFDPDDVVLLEASLTKALASHGASALEIPEQEVGVVSIFERRRIFACKEFGEDSDYATACSADIGRCYHRQGRHAAAEKIFTQILTTQELRYGKGSVQALDASCNLALLYHDQGRLEEGEALDERVYEGRKSLLGDDHVATLDAMVNLAMVYWGRGRLSDAERFNLDVLERWRSVMGEDNPGLMNILNNLAMVYREMGKYDRACQLFQEALEGRERLLGKEHPDSMASLSNLGQTLTSEGKLKDALAALEESLSRRRRVLMKHHIDTLEGIHSLALVYERLGRDKDAEELLNEALPACHSTLPSQHPYTLNVLSTMSLVYAKQGRYKEAEDFQNAAFEGRKQVQGKRHPTTISCEHNLGLIFRASGDLKQAEHHFREAYDLRCTILGIEHPDTIESKQMLSASIPILQ